jgi:glycosyltransferase involved in cell wall biosynthesis
LGIFENTRFVGKQQDMEDIYAIADLFLLPSEYESFGLSALEAMAAGTPVIATNSGGIPEVVTHGSNGFLSEIGDVESMSRQAISLLSNPALLQQFSNAAKEQAIKFDIVNIVPQYEKLYAEVLAK